MLKISLYSLSLLFLFLMSSCEEADVTHGGPTGDDATIALSAQTSISDAAGNTYQVGFDQVSSNNQDPFVRKTNRNGEELWRLRYENTPVDGRALLVALDAAQNPWVVFSVDGGSNDGGYITRKELDNSEAFTNVFQNSYGRGGGPKVSVLARLNPENGKIQRGTFVTARLDNGNTNTLRIVKLGFVSDGRTPAFEIESAAWPPGEGSSFVRMPNLTNDDRIDGAFKIYYEMDTNLSAIRTARLLVE
ncbi:MAG: hypothetical protein JJT94_07355 [Bernardetiaceae bacterium]|nr:hypothetical protein [Bernardetiaceae bacterium]